MSQHPNRSLAVLLAVSLLGLGSLPAAQEKVIINEFLALNNTVLADEDGDYADWIELFNAGATAVNLGGWHLTDQTNDAAPWTFPSTNLPAGSFLVVFASGKDRTNAGAPLHTSFALSGDGEYLALLRPDGSIASAFAPAFPKQYDDISFGLGPGGTNDVYMSPPTPGRGNTAGYPAVAPPVRFSKPGGVYAASFSVTLTNAIPGAKIRYTLNGTKPTETSTLYSAPITVDRSVILRARAFGSGYFPSPPVEEAFTLLENNVTNFNTRLPIVLIDTYANISADMNPKSPVSVTIIDADPATGRAVITGRPDLHHRAGLELRGQTSAGFDKKPFNLEFWDQDDRDDKVAFLDFPSGADFAFISLWNDKTFLNDYLAHELFSQMGETTIRHRYVEVFWNGVHYPNPQIPYDGSPKLGTNDYVGIYMLAEKIRVDKNRVNIAKLTPADNAEPEISGGYIWKKDKDSPDDVNFTTSSGQLLKYHDPPGADLSQAQRDWLVHYLNEFEADLYGPNWTDPLAGYAQYIDVDSFVNQHWIVEFSKQIDGYRLSDYMHKDRGGKIKMAPIWDWNLSFGNANYADGGHVSGWYYTLVGADGHIWLERLISAPGDPEFLQKITDRWGELRATVFHPSNLLAEVDAITNYLWEAQARDFARFPRLGAALWPNPDGAGWDVDYVHPATYSGIIGEFKKWVTGRYNWIDTQFVKPPVFSRYSGTAAAPLNMSAPAGAIYYTLAGNDPRAPGGGLAPNARLFTNAFLPPAGARIVARALEGAAWSPPARASLGDVPPALAVTEIMYHPDHPLGTNYHAEDFEFLELANPGTNAIDLAGMRLSEGIEFIFPAGDFAPISAPTTNSFDTPGTPYATARLGAGPDPSVKAGGSAGSFLRLLTRDTGTNNNRAAFDQTAAGPYGKLVADFDFRATNAAGTTSTEAVTAQDFDGSGTPYALANFDSDANTPALLPGDGGSTGQFIRLTEYVGGELGGLFFAATERGTNRLVAITFDFRLAGAADGMGMVFLDCATWGTNGPTATVWSEEATMANSIGVGFDIYNNGPTSYEPNANHVSLHWNGQQMAPAVTPALSLAAGMFHRAQITINFSGGQAFITVQITPNIGAGGGATETLYNNAALPGVPAYRGRLAFCGRTGGATANQDIDNVNVQYYDSISAPGGLSLVFLPAAAFGAAGRGSTLAHYTNAPTLANALALNLDLHANPAINNASLYWNGAPCADAYLAPSQVDLDSGVFHHVHLEAVRVANGALATLTLTPDVFGNPGAPLTVFTNLFVSGCPLDTARVELAARSGGQNISLDVDNLAVAGYSLIPNVLAPGERIVVVKNRAAFQARYGTGVRIAGPYSGSLGNGGERIVLRDAWGGPMLEFKYQDDWRPLADGQGFSLVLTDPNAPASSWSEAQSWQLSGYGGSPGQAGSAPPAVVPVFINEVLSHSSPGAAPGMDAIELYNPAPELSANIGGWCLSDDPQNPKKYRLPDETILLPGGYLVVYETNFNAVPGSPASFGLNAGGDRVYLFSADPQTGTLTGYAHGFDFGPADLNVTFGRVVTSTGEEQMAAQAQNTLGGPNAGPSVGPVIISEIMYHPPDYPNGNDNSADEFIELRNTSGAPAPLYDTSHPTNTWRLTDAVDFAFPPGAVLAAGGYLLAVNFDPLAEPGRLAAFRAKYAVNPAVPIYGPYGGKLGNHEQRLELKKPGVPGPETGQTDYILVERVHYRDQSPWPLAADGMGRSLQRADPAAYGNDPAHWIAALPTAGADNVTSATAPTLVSWPVDQTVIASAPATLAVSASSPEPLRYQWRFNGANLPGATNASLVLPAVKLDQAGQYQAVVMSPTGATASPSATLTVWQGAAILTQPLSGTIWLTNASPTNMTFSVAVLGNGPVTYQWQFNGLNLLAATNASLTITNVQLTQAGTYRALVSDAVGTVWSDPAQLVLLAPVNITQQPRGSIVALGDNATLSLGVYGAYPVTNRWYYKTALSTLPGASNVFSASPLSFTITNVQATNAGSYRSLLSNPGRGSLFTSNAYLVVVDPPVSQVVPPGANVTFSLMVTGAGAYRFQWKFNGADLFGATNQNYTILNVKPSDAGAYAVVVNASTNVPILPLPPATFPASLSVRANPGLDSDGDGMSDGDELLAGTDPDDPASCLKLEVWYAACPNLRFLAAANHSYSILYMNCLTNTGWLKLGDFSAQPAAGPVTLRDTNAAPARYYRLVTPRRLR